jgi:PAS domain S-box-containing protein
MRNLTILLSSFAVLVSVFVLAVLWEFFFEYSVRSIFTDDIDLQQHIDQIKYVITTTVFVAIALLVPTLALMQVNAKRNKAEDALQISEERFELMMDASPTGMFFRDLDGRFLISNRAYQNFYENAQDVVGKTVYDINPPKDAAIYAAQDKQVIDTGKAQEYEFERIRDSGEKRYYSAVRFPIFDGNGKIEGVGGIISNITERKQADKVVVQAMNDLAQSSQAKTTFLAHMSHELRTPLNAVIGFSQMMEDRTFGPLGAPQYEEYAAIINSSGEHLLELINDVLDLSKIEAGRLEAEVELVDVEKLISSSIAVVRVQAKANDLSLYTEIADNLPHLLADPRMVKQMLFNLLSNAVKFTDREGHIKVVADVATDGGVKISVIDDGIGIDSKDIPTVFAPYGQVTSQSNDKQNGTGLGIPLVVELLTLHHGELEFESEVDKGTTMTLAFPPHATQCHV